MGNRVKLQAAAMYKGPSINDVGNWEGSKIRKNCRCCLWMVPNSRDAVRFSNPGGQVANAVGIIFPHGWKKVN